LAGPKLLKQQPPSRQSCFRDFEAAPNRLDTDQRALERPSLVVRKERGRRWRGGTPAARTTAEAGTRGRSAAAIV